MKFIKILTRMFFNTLVLEAQRTPIRLFEESTCKLSRRKRLRRNVRSSIKSQVLRKDIRPASYSTKQGDLLITGDSKCNYFVTKYDRPWNQFIKKSSHPRKTKSQ